MSGQWLLLRDSSESKTSMCIYILQEQWPLKTKTDVIIDPRGPRKIVRTAFADLPAKEPTVRKLSLAFSAFTA